MTILNQYPMPYTNAISMTMGVFFIAIAVVMVFIAGATFDDEPGTVIAAGLTFVLAVGIGTVFILGSKQESKSVTYYEVILEDDYPLKELLNQYELVEQRGEIYVIKEKEKDDGK